MTADQLTTLEVPRDDWTPYFDTLSRQHEGEPVTVELLAAPAQILAHELPLLGISAELTGDEGTIAVMLGGGPGGEHLTHLINDPTRVAAEGFAALQVAALRIDAADGPTTVVRFHNRQMGKADTPPRQPAVAPAGQGGGAGEHQRWEVRIGSLVEAPDGRLGKVKQVVIRPHTRQVTHIIVEQGFLLHHDVIVPVEAIESADDDRVRLLIGANEINAGPAYDPESTVAPHPSWEPPRGYAARDVRHAQPDPPSFWERLVPRRDRRGERQDDDEDDDEVVVIEGMTVECLDGPLGSVALVLLDATTRRATHCVVRLDGLLGRHVIVPLGWASGITDDRIILDVGKEHLDHVPDYRPDGVIKSEVVAALWDEGALRWLDLPNIRVDARDGVVTLRGHVANREHRALAARAARRVTGVLAVRDELVADDDLAVAVAQALARDPRTKGLRPQVEAYYGAVYLKGKVPSGSQLAAAEEVAASVPGVRTVVSALSAPDAAPAPETVILPPVGVPVYATDGEVGRSEAVIMDPRTRRATGLVVEGRFPPDQVTTPGAPAVPRRVVVPVEEIARAMVIGIDLRRDHATVANLPEYREQDYVIPGPDWQPPIDYRHRDVRFPRNTVPRPAKLVPAPADDAIWPNLPVKHGQRVVARGIELGPVDRLVIDPTTREATHLVVRASPLLPRDSMIPVERVARVEDGWVVVDADPEELAPLPAGMAQDPAGTAAPPAWERSDRSAR